MPFVYSVRGKYNNPTPENSDSPLTYLKVKGGDSVYTAGGYVIHTFTSVGQSALTIDPINANMPTKVMGLIKQGLEVEYLVIGGGGAGGSRHGAGGGAGGFVQGATALGIGPNAITVGSGGAGITGDSTGNNGQTSQLTSLIQARGGGGGGSWGAGGNGNSGGSGGGACGSSNNNFGSAQIPASLMPGSQSFGNPGGSSTAWDNPIGYLRVGGGGGAGTKGENAELIGPNSAGRNQRGGEGRTSSITGTQYYWAGGGGGAGWGENGGSGGQGGAGGGTGNTGGAGGTNAINNGQNGANSASTSNGVGGTAGANTGSGGGGGQQTPSTGGSGGPGIVVVRYRR